MSDDYDDTRPCPKCGADSGMVANFSTLMDEGRCAACGVRLEVELEDNIEGYAMWLTALPSTPDGYETRVTCPACGALLDVIAHPDPKPNAQMLAAIANTPRRKHAKLSPGCKQHDRWHLGWDTKTEPRYKA